MQHLVVVAECAAPATCQIQKLLESETLSYRRMAYAHPQSPFQRRPGHIVSRLSCLFHDVHLPFSEASERER